jgi:hypothetical protein
MASGKPFFQEVVLIRNQRVTSLIAGTGVNGCIQLGGDRYAPYTHVGNIVSMDR